MITIDSKETNVKKLSLNSLDCLCQSLRNNKDAKALKVVEKLRMYKVDLLAIIGLVPTFTDLGD